VKEQVMKIQTCNTP